MGFCVREAMLACWGDRQGVCRVDFRGGRGGRVGVWFGFDSKDMQPL